MTTNILFLCPHNAAKSVASAAFFERSARSQGLDVSIATAGTDPDDAIHPVVRARLERDGLSWTASPRLVSADDLAEADIIVNIGCDPGDLATDKSLVEWRIPNFSEDPAVAFAAIESHVDAMAVALASRSEATPG